MQKIKLYNTLTKQKEDFVPINEDDVKVYNCGPTVYDYVHVGNLFSFMFYDNLRRILEYFGYKVTQVMNITDVGHLVDDEDEGEDKIEKGARRTGKTVYEVAQYFTDEFIKDSKKMNFIEPSFRPKASDHIPEMIEMIKTLIEKGLAYVTTTAVYFDVSKFADYTKLSGQNLEANLQKSRDDVVEDPTKKNWYDFRLWQLDQPNHVMQWESPWGKGFPGWHIECSAMSRKYLGETIDIHTGGIDHIPTHHTNEIAQSEGTTGQKYANYWLHNQHILIHNEKMAKSAGNTFRLEQLEEKGYDSLDLRLLYLQSKYREQLNFTFESLDAAHNALQNLKKQVQDLVNTLRDQGVDFKTIKADKKANTYQIEFQEGIADDLNTAVGLSVLYKLMKDQNIDPKEKLEQVLSFDKVLGLRLDEIKPKEESDELKKMKKEWEEARAKKDWGTADKLRALICELEK